MFCERCGRTIGDDTKFGTCAGCISSMVETVRKAIEAYREPGRDETEDVVTDFLCDLKHFCDVENIGFDQCVERAQRHYLVEMGEEEP